MTFFFPSFTCRLPIPLLPGVDHYSNGVPPWRDRWIRPRSLRHFGGAQVGGAKLGAKPRFNKPRPNWGASKIWQNLTNVHLFVLWKHKQISNDGFFVAFFTGFDCQWLSDTSMTTAWSHAKHHDFTTFHDVGLDDHGERDDGTTIWWRLADDPIFRMSTVGTTTPTFDRHPAAARMSMRCWKKG